MTKIKIKPLSVNQAWQGRRFKTKEYKNYEEELLWLLPNKYPISKEGKLLFEAVVGLSSKNADIDNFIKTFFDVLQKKYSFNDKRIYELHVKKVDVEKGKEFVNFDILNYPQS